MSLVQFSVFISKIRLYNKNHPLPLQTSEVNFTISSSGQCKVLTSGGGGIGSFLEGLIMYQFFTHDTITRDKLEISVWQFTTLTLFLKLSANGKTWITWITLSFPDHPNCPCYFTLSKGAFTRCDLSGRFRILVNVI